MKIRKAYAAALCGTAAIIAGVFGISKYNGKENAVPVMSYVEETTVSEARPIKAEKSKITENDVKTDDIEYPLDLNTATAEELCSIDGIGEATAEKITAYAKEYGFETVDDLLNIDGIGEKKASLLKEYVTVKNAKASAIAEEKAGERTTAENTVSQTSELININTAAKEQLKELNGVGDVIAERIIEYRNEHPFEDVEELINIKGIGEKKMEKIRPYVTV